MSGELIAFYLAMIVYMTDGTPLPQMFILKPEEGCNLEVAQRYARQHIPLPEGVQLQDWGVDPDKLKWFCFPVERGTEGPALRPALLDNQTDAAAKEISILANTYNGLAHKTASEEIHRR